MKERQRLALLARHVERSTLQNERPVRLSAARVNFDPKPHGAFTRDGAFDARARG